MSEDAHGGLALSLSGCLPLDKSFHLPKIQFSSTANKEGTAPYISLSYYRTVYMFGIGTVTSGGANANALTFSLLWLLTLCPSFWSVLLLLSFEPAWGWGGEVPLSHDAWRLGSLSRPA